MTGEPAPEWFVTKINELQRLMSSTPRSIADGLMPYVSLREPKEKPE